MSADEENQRRAADGACLGVLEKYRGYLQQTCDEHALVGNSSSQTAQRGGAHRRADRHYRDEDVRDIWLDDDDDFDIFSPPTDVDATAAAADPAASDVSSDVLSFREWLRARSQLADDDIDAIARDKDAAYVYDDDDDDDDVIAAIDRDTSPPPGARWHAFERQNAANALYSRFESARMKRLAHEEELARAEDARRRERDAQLARERELAMREVPRALRKPMMRLARTADNARLWQTDALGTRDVDSAFYDLPAFQQLLSTHPDLTFAARRPLSIGDAFEHAYRSFLYELDSPAAALRFADHPPLPALNPQLTRALPPRAGAPNYRLYSYVSGVIARDQRVEVAMLEHFAFLAALAWLEWNNVDNELRNDLLEDALEHAEETLYPALLRKFTDSSTGKEVERARDILKRRLCGDESAENMILAAVDRDPESERPRKHAWLLQTVEILFPRVDRPNAGDDKPRAENRLAVKPYLQLYLREYVADTAAAIRAGAVGYSTRSKKRAKTSGAAKRRTSVATASSSSVAAAERRLRSSKPMDQVFVMRIDEDGEVVCGGGDAPMPAKYVAMSPSKEVMAARGAAHRRRLIGDTDWSRVHSQALVYDDLSPALRLDAVQSVALSRALMRHGERDVSAGLSQSGAVDESAYFAALAHYARSANRQWRVRELLALDDERDVVASRKEVHVLAGELVGAHEPYEYVRENSVSLPYVMLCTARRGVHSTLKPPFLAAAALGQALAVGGPDALLRDVAESDVFVRDQRRSDEVANLLRHVREVRAEQSVYDRLYAKVLFDAAMRTPAGSSARVLLALRLVQESRVHIACERMASGALFNKDAEGIMLMKSAHHKCENNELARRAIELYRTAMNMRAANRKTFADMFGLAMSPQGSREYGVRTVNRARAMVGETNIFAREFWRNDENASAVEVVTHVLATALDVIYADIGEKAFDDDFEARVALLCMCGDDASLYAMFRELFMMMTSERYANDGTHDLEATIYLGIMMRSPREAMKAFAASFAAMCVLCEGGASRLASGIRALAAEARSVKALEDASEEAVALENEEGSARCKLIAAADEYDAFWRGKSFDPMSPNAQIAVFGGNAGTTSEFAERVKTLSNTLRVTHICGWDGSEGHFGSNTLATFLRQYARGIAMTVSATDRASCDDKSYGCSSHCVTVSASECRHTAAVALYFARLLWNAARMAQNMRDCKVSAHVPMQLTNDADVCATALALAPTRFSEKNAVAHCGRSAHLAHAHLTELACECLSSLLGRFSRTDDPESSIQVNAANGAADIDKLVISALYFDYLACAWHDLDLASEVAFNQTRGGRDTSTRSLASLARMNNDCMSLSAPSSASEVHTDNLRFISILNEVAEKRHISSCAWLVPPNVSVAKYLDEHHAAAGSEEQCKRELVMCCCVPVSLCTLKLKSSGHGADPTAARNSDLWLLRFATMPFANKHSLEDVVYPRGGHVYAADSVPAPLPEWMRASLKHHVFY